VQYTKLCAVNMHVLRTLYALAEISGMHGSDLNVGESANLCPLIRGRGNAIPCSSLIHVINVEHGVVVSRVEVVGETWIWCSL